MRFEASGKHKANAVRSLAQAWALAIGNVVLVVFLYFCCYSFYEWTNKWMNEKKEKGLLFDEWKLILGTYACCRFCRHYYDGFTSL